MYAGSLLDCLDFIRRVLSGEDVPSTEGRSS
jgi:hypothetical protein